MLHRAQQTDSIRAMRLTLTPSAGGIFFQEHGPDTTPHEWPKNKKVRSHYSEKLLCTILLEISHSSSDHDDERRTPLKLFLRLRNEIYSLADM